jgi:hypothetical protein
MPAGLATAARGQLAPAAGILGPSLKPAVWLRARLISGTARLARTGWSEAPTRLVAPGRGPPAPGLIIQMPIVPIPLADGLPRA